jgi:hypothetical protein
MSLTNAGLNDDSPSDETGNTHHSVHPPSVSPQQRPWQRLPTTEGIREKAMDQLNLVSMFLQGATRLAEGSLEGSVDRQMKQMEEGDIKAQEASQSKVMEWIESQATDISGP